MPQYISLHCVQLVQSSVWFPLAVLQHLWQTCFIPSGSVLHHSSEPICSQSRLQSSLASWMWNCAFYLSIYLMEANNADVYALDGCGGVKCIAPEAAEQDNQHRGCSAPALLTRLWHLALKHPPFGGLMGRSCSFNLAHFIQGWQAPWSFVQCPLLRTNHLNCMCIRITCWNWVVLCSN